MWVLALACAEPPEVRLPGPDGPYAPSRLEVRGPVEVLADTASCTGCHADQAREWQASAHAHASFDNPWYRHSVEVLRDEVGNAASRHCAGCHDPVLLVLGRMDAPVDPADPLARVGVPCLVCHAVREVRPDGNASLVVDLTDVAYGPDHAARMLPDALREGRVCGGCHRGLLGPETGNRSVLVGMDDQGGWKGSSYAGSDAAVLSPTAPVRATCVDCHVTDHRFPGAHTALAATTGALDAPQQRLRGAATVLVGAVWAGGRSIAPEHADGPIDAVDVVVWNTGTGHRFPGGTLDLQDTWLEVVFTDADGGVLASSGTAPGDPSAARFKAIVVDAEGRAVTTHDTAHIATAAADRTVPPGLARATRFVLPGPADVARISVRLLHRRHPEAMAEAGCRATLPSSVDGCLPQPITLVDEDGVALGEGPGSYGRAFAHALALTHEVQERLDDARPAALEARRLAQDDREIAAAHWLLARIAGRQGRLAEALAAADEAEREIGPHPAIERARGEAYAQVWAWDDATEAFARAAELAPGDTTAWRDLARARGSSGDPLGALTAAVKGLALQPRDPDLLRSQALALEDLGDPRAVEALEAWLAHRPPDDAADLRMACDRQVEHCARDRDPVPEIQL